MGELVKQGWKPKRTIVYAAWDGEEPALLGSTEWVETHADELAQQGGALLQHRRQRPRILRRRRIAHARAFHGRGREGRSTDPGDEPLGVEARAGADDRERRAGSRAARRGTARICASRRSVPVRTSPRSSSTPACRRSTAASAARTAAGSTTRSTTASTGTPTSAIRRSCTARALAQTVGTTVMRMADADLLPFEFGNLAETVQGYTAELKELHDNVAAQIAETNRELEDGDVRRDERSARSAPAAQGAAARARAELRAARQRGWIAHVAPRHGTRRRTAPRSPRAPTPRRSRASTTIVMQADQALLDAERAAEAAVVQTSALRARAVHRIRREDDARRARGDRAEGRGARRTSRSGGWRRRCSGRPTLVNARRMSSGKKAVVQP